MSRTSALHHNIAAACAYSPLIRQVVANHSTTSLRDYAASLFAPSTPVAGRSTDAFRNLAAELAVWVQHQHGPDFVDHAMNEFGRNPVLQTADHAEVLFSPARFSNNLLGRLGIIASGGSHLFVNASSTVTMKTRAGEGPGFLNFGGSSFNLFGDMSGKTMSRTSVGGSTRTASLRLSGFNGLPAPEKNILQRLHAVVSETTTKPTGITDVFSESNTSMWQAWDTNQQVRAIFTDDRLTADVVARDIEQRQPGITELLFNPNAQRKWLEAQASIARRDNGFTLSHSTDFFWRASDHRIRPLRLNENQLVDPSGKTPPVEMTPDAISVGLRSGQLMPDLATGFLAIAILPGVRVLGGASQTVYIDKIAQIAKYALSSEVPEPQNGWIGGVLELDHHPLTLLAEAAAPGQELDAITNQYGSRSLALAVGKGDSLQYIAQQVSHSGHTTHLS